MSTLQTAHPNMSVYLKQDIPARFHYNNNRRITPIVGIAGPFHKEMHHHLHILFWPSLSSVSSVTDAINCQPHCRSWLDNPKEG